MQKVGFDVSGLIRSVVAHAAVFLYYIKAPVSTVIPHHLFTNNPSHLFQINPLHIRPLRATLHEPVRANARGTQLWLTHGTRGSLTVPSQFVSPLGHLVKSA
jgi:hypothetical protein